MSAPPVESTERLRAFVATPRRPRPAPRPRNRIDELVARLRPIAEQAVDRYEIAAVLEADGVTDASAVEHYGRADVFVLASAVQQRVRPRVPDRVEARTSRSLPWRDVAHGVLYLLPAAVFPVGLTLLGRPVLLVGVLLIGGVGWLWSGVAAWVAWQFKGQHRPASAARVLRFATLAALPMGVVVGVAMMPVAGGSFGLVAVGVAQMAFQMSSTLLMFYRGEAYLYAAMAPAVLAGVAYLVVGPALLPAALAVATVSVTVALVAGLLYTVTSGRGGEPPVLAGLRRMAPNLPVVVLHTAASAVFLLQAQSRFMFGSLAVLVAFLPLVAGMGVVEWRARRFGEEMRAILATVTQVRQFRLRAVLLLARDAGICGGAVAVLAGLLLASLALLGVLHPAATVLSAAVVVLSMAYLLGFLLANAGRLGWLAAALALCGALQFLTVNGPYWEPSPLREATVLLGVSALLLLLFMALFVALLPEVRNFR